VFARPRAFHQLVSDAVGVANVGGTASGPRGHCDRLDRASQVPPCSARFVDDSVDLIDEQGKVHGAGIARDGVDNSPTVWRKVFEEFNCYSRALDAMRPNGRVALCGAISDFNSTDDEKYSANHLFKATERGITLRGFLARMYADKWDDFHSDVSRWLATGSPVSPETVIDGLDATPQAFIDLLRGSNIGKMLVRMSD